MANEKENALTHPIDGDLALREIYDEAAEAEAERLNPQPPYDYAILHIPALRAVAEYARDAENQRVQSALVHVEKIIEMYRHLVLDTPEDQEIHAKVTKLADDALAAVKRMV